MVTLAAMLVGMLARVALGVDSLRSGRDALAYIFVALVSIAISRWYDSQSMVEIARAVVRWMGWYVGIQILAAVIFRGPDIWWFGPRFRGFSQDPNQMGFYVLALPFLALWLRSRTYMGVRPQRVWDGVGLAALLIVCATVAVLTQSDSLLVAWVAGGLAAYFRYYIGSLFRPIRGYWRGALTLFVGPAVVLALVVGYSSFAVDAVTRSLDELVTKDNQAATRMALWESAMEVVYDSPLVGWGPGSYAGPTGPYGEFEAHNSYLQLATNSGMIGLGALVLFLLSVWAATWNSGSPWLAGAAVAVMVLMFFHHSLRHPVLWFTLCALLAMASLPTTAPRRHLNVKVAT